MPFRVQAKEPGIMDNLVMPPTRSARWPSVPTSTRPVSMSSCPKHWRRLPSIGSCITRTCASRLATASDWRKRQPAKACSRSASSAPPPMQRDVPVGTCRLARARLGQLLRSCPHAPTHPLLTTRSIPPSTKEVQLPLI